MFDMEEEEEIMHVKEGRNQRVSNNNNNSEGVYVDSF
jgi:hypothetical protein